MTMTTPQRSADQRLAALEQANRVRTARAHLKRCLRTDPEDARRVIANPSIDYRGMLLRDLLTALPRMGEMKVDRWMFSSMIHHRRTIGGLSSRQREAAIGFMSEYLRQRRKAAA
jgi:hypothetical protein